MFRKIITYYVLLCFAGFLYSQDIPEEFEYNTSTQQAFYFFKEAKIDGWNIQEGDKIIAYKSDEDGWPIGGPVGGGTWAGEYSDIVVLELAKDKGE